MPLLRRLVQPSRADEFENVSRGGGNVGAGTEDRSDARVFEIRVILRRHHTTDDDENVTCTSALQRLY